MQNCETICTVFLKYLSYFIRYQFQICKSTNTKFQATYLTNAYSAQLLIPSNSIYLYIEVNV